MENINNRRIKVIDSYLGSGKTSYCINKINDLPEDVKIIYITPYIKEVERIIQSCPSKNFYQPNANKGKGKKIVDLLSLVRKGKNIVSTHALFSNITDDLVNAFKNNNYMLFLDEVFQTIEHYDFSIAKDRNERQLVTAGDVKTLLATEQISINDDFSVVWNNHEMQLSKYQNLINMADRGLLYYVYGNLLLWTFPVEVFKEGVFNEVYILTYRFESQIQYYYYNYFDIPFTKYQAYKDNNNIYQIEETKDNSRDILWKESIKNKVHILENDKLNKIGNVFYDSQNRLKKSALSMSWYEKNSDILEILKNNLDNYFKHITNSKSNQRLWTTHKENISDLKSKNVGVRSWLACNARATNLYADKNILAYMINKYVDPFYDDFFERKNIKINQDEFGLTDMLQWIWRSAIRNNEDIEIYIPSQRMRELLKKFLNNEEIKF